MRSRLVPLARGRVLEIGVGTGANVPFYSPSSRVTAIDESIDMLKTARHRWTGLVHHTTLSQMDTEYLAFPSGCFDTVVATLVLCSVVDQARALREAHRVLNKTSGRLLLLEHMRPQALPLALLTDLANIPWHAFNGRCHLNRQTEKTIIEAGFQLHTVETKLGGLLQMAVARVTAN
jgi:ubiquinone/menaquinone biosynthesis C-methylase UbiE